MGIIIFQLQKKGLTKNLFCGFLFSFLLFLPAIAWQHWGARKISLKLETEFKNKDYIESIVSCSFCGAKAVQVASYLKGNLAIAFIRCVDGCGQTRQNGPRIVKFG